VHHQYKTGLSGHCVMAGVVVGGFCQRSFDWILLFFIVIQLAHDVSWICF